MNKPGYQPLPLENYRITLKTPQRTITCGADEQIPLSRFQENETIIIPKLFENETILENLVCVSPVLHL